MTLGRTLTGLIVGADGKGKPLAALRERGGGSPICWLMRQALVVLLFPAALFPAATVADSSSLGSCESTAAQPVCAPLAVLSSRNDTNASVAGGVNVPRVVYAEHFGTATDDWGSRINMAIQAGFVAGGAEVVLPVGTLDVAVPIKLWRVRRTSVADTSASNVTAFAAIGQVWEAIKGGAPSDLPRGFHLHGVPGGGYASQALSTRLRWVGANDSVMIDMPAPWHCRLSDMMLDGNGVGGVVGVRYRAGYEFQANGGKANVFERLSLFSLHVGMEVGGPLIPDLVGSSFRNLEIHDVGIGLRFFGGNVAEMWVSELMIASWSEAAIALQGYSIRIARPRATSNTTTLQNPLVDADVSVRTLGPLTCLIKLLTLHYACHVCMYCVVRVARFFWSNCHITPFSTTPRSYRARPTAQLAVQKVVWRSAAGHRVLSSSESLRLDTSPARGLWIPTVGRCVCRMCGWKG